MKKREIKRGKEPEEQKAPAYLSKKKKKDGMREEMPHRTSDFGYHGREVRV
jgi:hypothetical protein